MRLLFQLAETGYLRMYGSTVRLLSERGHTVLLSYDSPAKRRSTAATTIESLPGVEVVPPVPARSDRWARSAEQLRVAIDYVRFLDPVFSDAPYLRRRMQKYVSRPFAPLLRVRSPRLARTIARILLALERRIPTDPGVDAYLRAAAPDVVLVTPLIARGRSGVRQTDTVKSALRLGLPVAVGVSSWDHLTTKGLFKVVPDRIFVWNEVQLREAVELHGLPRERVVVTGAQLFDRWFDLRPALDRDAFVSEAGLDASEPYVLYVGSSPNVAAAALEIDFVRRWLEALRRRMPQLGVLVRPHPGNMDAWAPVDLGVVNAVVHPRTRPELPMDEREELLYLHSLRYAAAVVGLNTSAEIEALIQGRPVLTVTPPEFAASQAAPPHFRYLIDGYGGCVQAAETLEGHLDQLEQVLARPDALRGSIDEFLRDFVRPHGLDSASTPVLVDALEELVR